MTKLKFALNGVYSGGTPTAGNEAFYSDEGVPFVTIGDMSRGTPIRNTHRFVTPEGIENKQLKIVPKGSLLLSMYATIGLPNVLGIDATISQAILALFPKAGIESRYLYYWLLHIRPQLLTDVTGSTQGNLNAEKVKNITFRFLGEKTQIGIVDFLDRELVRIDQMIEKKQRMLELLDEKSKAIVKRLIFGHDLFGKVSSTGVPWMPYLPSEWQVQRAARMFRNLNSRRIPLNSEERAGLEKVFPYYGASGIIDYVDRFLFDEDLILVGEDGANLVLQSTPVAFIARGKYWVNNHAHVLRPILGPNEFWVHVLNQVPFEIYTTGSAQPKLTAEALGNIPIPVPPVSVQHRIAGEVQGRTSVLDVARGPIGASITLLQELRTSLITAAVTGQIDIDNWRKKGETERRLEAIAATEEGEAREEGQPA